MEEFKSRIPKEMLQQASFESTKEAQMSLRTHWGIWLSAGVVLAIIVSLCIALIPQSGRVHPYSGYTGSSESDSDSNPAVLFNPSEPSVSGFSPESSQVHFSSPNPAPPPSVTPRPRPTVNANVADHAKVLVWKYLSEPRYDVLTITRTDNTVAHVWDVSGQFAYVGGTVRTFDAIIEKQANGDWWLLAFSWW